MTLQVEEIWVHEAMYKSTSWALFIRVSTYSVTTFNWAQTGIMNTLST